MGSEVRQVRQGRHSRPRLSETPQSTAKRRQRRGGAATLAPCRSRGRRHSSSTSRSGWCGMPWPSGGPRDAAGAQPAPDQQEEGLRAGLRRAHARTSGSSSLEVKGGIGLGRRRGPAGGRAAQPPSLIRPVDQARDGKYALRELRRGRPAVARPAAPGSAGGTRSSAVHGPRRRLRDARLPALDGQRDAVTWTTWRGGIHDSPSSGERAAGARRRTTSS